MNLLSVLVFCRRIQPALLSSGSIVALRRRIAGMTGALLTVIAVWSPTSRALELHVSPSGSDMASGDVQHPLASLGQALMRIRESRPHPSESRTITLHGGTYFIAHTIQIAAADSGTAQAPLRIQAAVGEKVVFHGGIRLGPDVVVRARDAEILDQVPADARDSIWVVDLKAHGITNYGVLRQHGFGSPVGPAEMEISVDDVPWHLARYPNDDHEILKIGRIVDQGSVPRDGDPSNRGAVFGYEYARVERWLHADDLWLHGRFSFGYADDNLEVAAIDPAAKTIRTVQPHLYGVRSSLYPDPKVWKDKAGLSIRGYYAYNLLQELDAPHEYYIDRPHGLLYLYGHSNPVASYLDLSILETPLLALRGVHDVTITGIEFTCARGMGVYENDTDHVRLDGCSFRRLGTVGISMGLPLAGGLRTRNRDNSPGPEAAEGGSFHDNVIANCIVAENGTGGVIVAGGDRRTLRSANNIVENCEFYANGRRNETYSPSVSLLGVGHVVRNCYFHDQRHESLAYQGNNFVIENNVFTRVCQYADDMGAIYTGRDPSARGTRIRHNFFSELIPPRRDARMCAIYVDDGSGGIIIERNIFCHAGNAGDDQTFAAIFLHGGHDNRIDGNLFVDCSAAVSHTPWDDKRWTEFLKSELIQNRLLHDVDITSETYLKAYPALTHFLDNPRARTNTASDNLLYRTPLVYRGDFTLRENHDLTAPPNAADPKHWTLGDVAARFGNVATVKSLLAQPIGLNLEEFKRWHPEGPRP